MGIHEHFENLKKEVGIRHCLTDRDKSRVLDFSLACHTGQDSRLIESNRAVVQERFGAGAHFVSLNQVHGDRVFVAQKAENTGWHLSDETVDADAVVTNIERVVLSIMSADCVPVLLYDPIERVVAAIHAGWRGSEKAIAKKTVDTMIERYGTDPANILAGIGPAIDVCCYEVDETVAGKFSKYRDQLHQVSEKNYMLDLKKINQCQLVEAGVVEERIEISPVCTSCSKEKFFSYRGEGGACRGRFMSCIMLDEKKGRDRA